MVSCRLTRMGVAARGIIYLLIGLLAAQIGMGSGQGEADQNGALVTVVATRAGTVAVWLTLYTAGLIGGSAFALGHQGGSIDQRSRDLHRQGDGRAGRPLGRAGDRSRLPDRGNRHRLHRDPARIPAGVQDRDHLPPGQGQGLVCSIRLPYDN